MHTLMGHTHTAPLWDEPHRKTERPLVAWRSSLPAVHQHGAHVRRLAGRGLAHKGEDGQGVLRHAHVRPLGVVVLDDSPLALSALRVAFLTLQGGRVMGRDEANRHGRWGGELVQHMAFRNF